MHKHSTITDTPWDRAPVTESEETVVAAWHVQNTCKEDSAIAGSSMFELCSSLCLNTSRFRTEKNLRNWNDHIINDLVQLPINWRRL